MTFDTDIVQLALAKAPCPRGLSFGVFQQRDSSDGLADGVLTVSYKGTAHTFAVLAKTDMRNAVLDRMVADVAQDVFGMPLLVIAHQVSSRQADLLMSKGIAFLDTAGNAFIDLPGLYLATTGKRAPSLGHRSKPSRAFQSSGLKVLFAFLTDPRLDSSPKDSLMNRPFRAISRQSGVALGSVGWILRDLQAAGYVVTAEKTRMLVDRKALLQKWVDNYADRLRPKQMIGRFSSPDAHWWHDFDLNCPVRLWGGEVAASKLMGYLKPK